MKSNSGAISAGSDIAELFSDRESERYALHTQFLNEQMVRVLRTIGYDVRFTRGQGQYLYDWRGHQYSCQRHTALLFRNPADSELSPKQSGHVGDGGRDQSYQLPQ